MHEKHRIVRKYKKRKKKKKKQKGNYKRQKRANEQRDGVTRCESPSHFIVTSHIKYSLPEVESGYCCI